LFDAATRTDRLIVQSDAGLFLVGVRPFGVDRIRERGASPGNIIGGGGHDRRGEQAGDGDGSQMFHVDLSCELKFQTDPDQITYLRSASIFLQRAVASSEANAQWPH
jgi:hypothetical protein